MHICFISGSYPPARCGVGDQVHRLAAGLAQAGEKISVVTSGQPRDLSSPGIQVYNTMEQWGAGQAWKLKKQVERIKPQIVHLHYPSLGYDKGLAPNLIFPLLHYLQPQWKCVLTLHEYLNYTRKGLLRLWPVIRSAHRIVSTNQMELNQIQRDYVDLAARTQLIPLGSNVGGLEDLPPAGMRQVQKLDSKRQWLLHFGTVMPNKGWEILLPALRRLRDEGLAVGLAVIGELDAGRYAYHREIEEQINALGLTGDIHFTGYLDPGSLARIVQQYAVAVLPYTDGVKLNRSSFIAMLAYGRAIVTSEPQYMLEQVRHGKHFWGVLPRDSKALADGIKYILNDRVMQQKLQQGSREVAAYFSWPRIVSLHRGMYKKLLVE